ncbi:MAG: S9 family peptidase [Ignavibacteriaceae bacterium]|nr:S9 family peptidase [Ignavibacteriaceae bacterium]
MKSLLFALLLFPFFIVPQNKRPLTVEDLWNIKRVGSFNVSPDGKMIVFESTSYSMDDNKGITKIYTFGTDGSNLRLFNDSKTNETEPAFTPDGKKISFVRDGQIWTCSLDGTGEEKITYIYSEASGYRWSPDGKNILFVSTVYPDCTDQDCNKSKDDEKEKSKVKAKIITELMYRFWNEWRGEKRSHLFLFNMDKKNFIDLTLNNMNDVPPIDLGSSNEYSISPDNSEIVLTMNRSKVVANSTDNDVFTTNLSDVSGSSASPLKKISESKGNDFNPRYSPDGKYLAYLSMKRAGFEADKKDIILYNRASGSGNNLTDKFFLSVDEFTWSPDSKTIYFVSENEIYSSVYKLDLASGNIKLLLKEHVNSELSVSPDGKLIYFKQQRTNLPYEIFSMNNDGSDIKQLTHLNADLLANIEMNPIETFWCEGAGKTKIQSIIIKPPFFDPSKKYPVIFLIHGGPQGHWDDDFHFRWNEQLFASKGYVVVSPNPRGSTGYGQKFTDEISGDWGGKPYIDLMNTFDYAIKNFKFIDEMNQFSAGASYGGYMENWMEGHTTRFNAVVSHDGVFNTESEFGTTEELWFPLWEFKGAPWQNRKLYEKWSPHRYIQNAKTPMLVVQGGRDFRVPEEQAFQLFTSLQMLGVESKFLYFPDEFHFVTKPQNSRLWWNTVFDWFGKHKK